MKMNDLINKSCDNIEGKATVKKSSCTKTTINNMADAKSQQYRLYCTLETIKPMTRNEIYIMTNSIQAHTFKIRKSDKIKLITISQITYLNISEQI